jgi:serine/threonine-protein kinase
VAGRLSHPNIVTIYDLGEDNGRVFIAMEYLRGESLRSRIARGKPSVEDALRILNGAARGLTHAHHRGITHRDIKPSNIFLCDSGQVKIVDFGLAHIHSSNLTRTGQVLGTPDYMSPEQVLGHRVDHRSDIFSLGSVSYELLTGRKPFAGRFIEKVLFKIVHDEPKPMESYDPSIPKELGPMVRTALAKQPKDRFQSVVEFQRELARLSEAPKINERVERSQADENEWSGVEPGFMEYVLDTLSTGRESSRTDSHQATYNFQTELSELLLSTLGPFGMEAVSPS